MPTFSSLFQFEPVFSGCEYPSSFACHTTTHLHATVIFGHCSCAGGWRLWMWGMGGGACPARHSAIIYHIPVPTHPNKSRNVT